MQIERSGSGPWPEVNLDGVKITLSAGGESLVLIVRGFRKTAR